MTDGVELNMPHALCVMHMFVSCTVGTRISMFPVSKQYCLSTYIPYTFNYEKNVEANNERGRKRRRLLQKRNYTSF